MIGKYDIRVHVEYTSEYRSQVSRSESHNRHPISLFLIRIYRLVYIPNFLTSARLLWRAAAASTSFTSTTRRPRGSRAARCATSARAGSASGMRCSAWASWARRSAPSNSAASMCAGPRCCLCRTRHLPPAPTPRPRRRHRRSPVAQPKPRHRHNFKHKQKPVLRAPSWPAEVSG